MTPPLSIRARPALTVKELLPFVVAAVFEEEVGMAMEDAVPLVAVPLSLMVISRVERWLFCDRMRVASRDGR